MSTPFRVLVTGARATNSAGLIIVRSSLTRVTANALAIGRPVIIIQGEADGVDREARDWADETDGVDHEDYPADWHFHGKAAGPIRNAQMVRTGADICCAFPAPDSRGTWDCLKQAARAGIVGRVYPVPHPDPAATLWEMP